MNKNKILLIDNQGPFNSVLLHYLIELQADILIRDNKSKDISDKDIKGIIISDGTGKAENAGRSIELIKKFSGHLPVLGINLGHQCIAASFGAKIDYVEKIRHGKSLEIKTDGEGIFSGIKRPFKALSYHSFIVSEDTLPSSLKISALSEDKEIMGIRHIRDKTEGIQFCPESIMSPMGKRILRNFLNQCSS